MDLMWIPVYRSWRLNERHYGALQGLNKQDMANKHGSEKVQKWRRTYDIRPPGLTITDRRHARFDPHYAPLKEEALPVAVSLKDTLHRVLPFWYDTIAPDLKVDKKVLIVAHGYSLRALVKSIYKISDEEVVAPGNIDQNVPGWELSFFLFDKLISGCCYVFNTSPCAAIFAHKKWFRFDVDNANACDHVIDPDIDLYHLVTGFDINKPGN